MDLKATIKARFGLSGPIYLLGPVFEAEIGPIEAVLDPKVNVCLKKKFKEWKQMIYSWALYLLYSWEFRAVTN